MQSYLRAVMAVCHTSILRTKRSRSRNVHKSVTSVTNCSQNSIHEAFTNTKRSQISQTRHKPFTNRSRAGLLSFQTTFKSLLDYEFKHLTNPNCYQGLGNFASQDVDIFLHNSCGGFAENRRECRFLCKMTKQ